MSSALENCNTKNPLLRDGHSRDNRYLKALHTRYARIEEHSLADFMNFALDYCKDLQYWDTHDKARGDWQEFFESDMVSVLSQVAVKDLDGHRLLLEELLDVTEDMQSVVKLEKSGIFDTLFHFIFIMAGEVNRWSLKAVSGVGFSEEIKRSILSQLKPSMESALGAYKYYLSLGIATNATNISEEWVNWIKRAKSYFEMHFSSLWFDDDSKVITLNDWIDNISEDSSLFEYSGTSELSKMKKAVEGIGALAEIFLQSETHLVTEAPKYITNAVTKWPHHKPHASLYLAFVRLFQYAQIHINSLTGKHLDFYYQDVLGFSHQSAVTDKVHLLVTLAKQVEQHRLEVGTALKAGRDNTGKLLFYQTNREVVLNKVSIEEPGDLKTVFIDRKNGNRVYQANVADSADGMGKAFKGVEPKWKAFGECQINSQGEFREEENRTMEASTLGFAIASPLFDLREGERTITLVLKVSNPPDSNKLDIDQIAVRLSGEKAWIPGTVEEYFSDTDSITISIKLESTAEPVLAFNAEALMDRNYSTNFPILEVSLINELSENSDYSYALFKNTEITEIDLTVDVTGIKNLVIQNNLGVLDVNKPFQPFGPRPVVGSTLYIGCDEAFKKPVTELKLDYDWLDAPPNFSSYYSVYNEELGSSFDSSSYKILLEGLREKIWDSIYSQYIEIFNTVNDETNVGYRITLPETIVDDKPFPYFPNNPGHDSITGYNNEVSQGFIRWKLVEPDKAFAHKDFTQIYAKRVVMLTSDSTVELPNEPYTPVLNSIALNYTAKSTLSLSASVLGSTESFFHLNPFGTQKINPGDSQHPLFPVFTTEIDNEQENNEGEMYVGLSNTSAPQTFSMYVKVAEGSADPELSKETIHWSVLTTSGWMVLTSKYIPFESTNQLNTSGIIHFTLPEDTDLNSTLLPPGKAWLRGTVLKNSGAACDVKMITTQAVDASFVENKNDPNYLANPLPEGTISKLVTKQREVKALEQPFASFGGKTAESDQHFHMRVSERLRHKNRALTMWDYEKLVLENFPDVYKVKCINHSTYLYDKEGISIKQSEFVPGFVTVIVIPDLTNLNAVNPLEPKISLNTLDNIKTYLQKIMPAFAAEKIQVLNPMYESIQLEFNVFFHSEFDPNFYSEHLNKELIEYLSPWAYFNSNSPRISFGGKIHRSLLLNFIEERSYVDYLTDFKMHHIDAIESHFNVEQATPSSARSIFVSHSEHKITGGISG